MNDDLIRKIDALTKRVAQLETAQNVNALRSMQDYFIKGTPTVTDTDVDRSVGVSGGGGGSVTVLDYPDRWVEMIIDNEVYRLGAWLKRNDASR